MCHSSTACGRSSTQIHSVTHRSSPALSPGESPAAAPSRGGARCTARTAVSSDSKVLDSRTAEDGGSIRRRRQCPSVRAALHHGRADAARGGQAQRRRRAVQPRQGRLRGAQGVQGPTGHRGPAGPARPARRGLAAGVGPARGPGRRGRGRHPRTAARPRPGGVPAVRQRLPPVPVGRRLRVRDRSAAHGERSRRARAAHSRPRRPTAKVDSFTPHPLDPPEAPRPTDGGPVTRTPSPDGHPVSGAGSASQGKASAHSARFQSRSGAVAANRRTPDDSTGDGEAWPGGADHEGHRSTARRAPSGDYQPSADRSTQRRCARQERRTPT